MQLGIHPEQITLAPETGGITVDVDVVEPTGPETFVLARLGKHEMPARLGDECYLREDETVTIGVDVNRNVLFDADSGARIDR